ncbi:MAG: hypothetical protein VW397_04610 [Candidatus Margulisiibacteriota bacterium]
MIVDLQGISVMTLVFAKVYGIYFCAVGLAILLNPARIRSWYEGILANKNLAMVGSTIGLIIGAFILATHHLVVPDWPFIITLIGYWGVVMGTAALISDHAVQIVRRIVNQSDAVYRLSGVAWLLLGVFLAMKGFV